METMREPLEYIRGATKVFLENLWKIGNMGRTSLGIITSDNMPAVDENDSHLHPVVS
jgi:hypothetical protein